MVVCGGKNFPNLLSFESDFYRIWFRCYSSCVHNVKHHIRKCVCSGLCIFLVGRMFREEKCGKYVACDELKVRPADCQETVSALGDHRANCGSVDRI